MKILLLGLLLLVGAGQVSFVEIRDGVRYEARVFNWDKEKYQDVQVEFHQDEVTIYFPDDKQRTATVHHPRENKDPKKIEAIDEERDVFWDITIKLIG